MSLTPEQDRALAAIAVALVATDPALARALTGPRPRRPGQSPTGLVDVVMVVLVALGVGLMPLLIGLSLHLPWATALGAVTVLSLPLVALRVMTRSFRRIPTRFRALG